MSQETAINRYRAPAISLHWLIAVLIFGGYGLGLFMVDQPVSPQKLTYFSWHKWIGVSVFLLALLRAGWRISHPAPKLAENTPAWQRWAAEGTHVLLYLLMFGIPLSGWLHSSAAGYQTVYLGLLPIPDLLGKNVALSKQLGEVHEYLNYALLLLLLLHAAAALKHHYLDRDDVLKRMLPASKGPLWSGLATAFAAVAFAVVLALNFGGGKAGPATPAAAAQTAVAASGEIAAEFKQMGVAVQGRFTRFTSSVVFDENDPSSAQAKVDVDAASFDIGAEEYNDEVRKPEWLDAAAHPTASFVSTAVTQLADGRYEALGTFSLKGKTQELRVPFTVTTEADGNKVFTGSASISRAAFGIGDASWNDVLEDAVVISFRLAVPAP